MAVSLSAASCGAAAVFCTGVVGAVSSLQATSLARQFRPAISSCLTQAPSGRGSSAPAEEQPPSEKAKLWIRTVRETLAQA